MRTFSRIYDLRKEGFCNPAKEFIKSSTLSKRQLKNHFIKEINAMVYVHRCISGGKTGQEAK